jgi:hypothetical protein
MADGTQITRWTVLVWQLLPLLDEGETLDVEETSAHIQDGTIFDWLRERFPFPKMDLSSYTPEGAYPPQEVIEELERIDNGVGPSDLGINNNGLAQLVAYAVQAIQTTAHS